MRSPLLVLLLLAAATPCATAGAAIQTAWFLDARIRLELNDQVSGNASSDPEYTFWSGRVRGGLRLSTGDFRFEAAGQAAGNLSLPENASSGPGGTYYTVNGNDTAPGRVGLLELNAVYQGPSVDVRLGRMAYADGNERSIRVERLDAIKRRRLTERLIGGSNWTNVSRRFDGVSAGVNMTLGRIDAMFLIPLAGNFDYGDAHEWIEDMYLFGLSFTNEYDSAIPGAELRFSAYQVLDDRPVVRSEFWAAPGDEIDVTTLVLSLVAGGARTDVLGWVAVQTGEWGLRAQEAVAFVVEAGWRFDTDWQPAVRLGYEQASGWDGREVEHKTFYNMLPTNHGYYGTLDLNAFQNLRDVRVEASVEPHPRLTTRLTGHGYWLVETTDAWYSGSGAYNTEGFGYTARRPAHGGDFGGSKVGVELDLDVSVTLRGRNKLEAGGAVFWGGRVAEEAFPVRSNAQWGYLQITGSI